jgi:chromosome segregation ATPase
VAELERRLGEAAVQAAQLDEAVRVGAANRALYAEELSRASRLAVELVRAQDAAERAGAEAARLGAELAAGEARAERAQDEATALRARSQQLQAALDARGSTLEDTAGGRGKTYRRARCHRGAHSCR